MIDFIPVSEYAHYFDVTVLCMVLTEPYGSATQEAY